MKNEQEPKTRKKREPIKLGAYEVIEMTDEEWNMLPKISTRSKNKLTPPRGSEPLPQAVCLQLSKPKYSSVTLQPMTTRESEERVEAKGNIGFPEIEANGSIDIGGHTYAATSYFSAKYSISRQTFSSRIPKDTPYLIGLSKKQKTKLYRVDIIEVALQDLLELPVVARNGIYLNNKEEEYITARSLGKQFEISVSRVRYFLRSLPESRGRVAGLSGRDVFLYSREKAERIINMQLQIPQLTSSTGQYIDADSISWDSIDNYARRHDVNVQLISKRIKKFQLETKSIRSVTGQKTNLYKTAEIDALVKDFFALPKVDTETLRYVHEEEGNQVAYVPAVFFYKKYNLSYRTLQRVLSEASVPTIEGREAKGRQTALYDEVSANVAITAFLALPKVPENGILEHNGNRFTYMEAIVNMYPEVTRKTIESFSKIHNVAQIQGRHTTGMEITLYDIDQLYDCIKEFLALPRVDKQTGLWTGDSGDRWISLFKTEQKYGISRTVLLNHDRNLSYISGRSICGSKIRLYREADILKVIGELKQENIQDSMPAVSPDEADALLDSLLQ